jgi:hypothetical protein
LLKDALLNCIDNEPSSSFESIDQYYGDRVYKLDWDNSFDNSRSWVKLIKSKLESKLINMANNAGYQTATIERLWFQQYVLGNTHGWHTHGDNFTGVYYLELPNNAPKTQLVEPYSQSEILTPDVKEGQIILFPSYVIHRAPLVVNQNLRKTIISFNVNLENIKEEVLRSLF